MPLTFINKTVDFYSGGARLVPMVEKIQKIKSLNENNVQNVESSKITHRRTMYDRKANDHFS